MATTIIKSGHIDVAAESVTVTATLDDLILSLPVDLKSILTAFKSHLDIDLIESEVPLKPSEGNFAFVEFQDLDLSPPDGTGLITCVIHLGKNRTSNIKGRDSYNVDYTANRIINLLAANQPLNHLAGIQGIYRLFSDSGHDYGGLLNKKNVQEASVSVTYIITAPSSEAYHVNS